MYSIAFIRSPSITFGNHRCTLVIVRHDASRGRDTIAFQDDMTIDAPKMQGACVMTGGPESTIMGLLDWELEALQGSTVQSSDGNFPKVWSQVRAQTIPWMVPYARGRIPRATIRLANGKIV
jgi:hypothetical protein